MRTEQGWYWGPVWRFYKIQLRTDIPIPPTTQALRTALTLRGIPVTTDFAIMAITQENDPWYKIDLVMMSTGTVFYGKN